MSWVKLYEEFTDGGEETKKNLLKERLDKLDELFDIQQHIDILHNILEDLSDRTDMSFYGDEVSMDLFIDLNYKKARNRKSSIEYTHLRSDTDNILNSFYLKYLDSFIDEKLKYAINIDLVFVSNNIISDYHSIIKNKDFIIRMLETMNRLDYKVAFIIDSGQLNGEYESFNNLLNDIYYYIDEYELDKNVVAYVLRTDKKGYANIRFRVTKTIDGGEFRDELDLS